MIGNDVGNELRIGTRDYRSSGSVFKPIIVNSLKITSSIDSDSTYYLPNPVRDGYTFDGWYKNSSLTNKVLDGDKLTVNKTLYAKWIANQ